MPRSIVLLVSLTVFIITQQLKADSSFVNNGTILYSDEDELIVEVDSGKQSNNAIRVSMQPPNKDTIGISTSFIHGQQYLIAGKYITFDSTCSLLHQHSFLDSGINQARKHAALSSQLMTIGTVGAIGAVLVRTFTTLNSKRSLSTNLLESCAITLGVSLAFGIPSLCFGNMSEREMRSLVNKYNSIGDSTK